MSDSTVERMRRLMDASMRQRSSLGRSRPDAARADAQRRRLEQDALEMLWNSLLWDPNAHYVVLVWNRLRRMHDELAALRPQGDLGASNSGSHADDVRSRAFEEIAALLRVEEARPAAPQASSPPPGRARSIGPSAESRELSLALGRRPRALSGGPADGIGSAAARAPRGGPR